MAPTDGTTRRTRLVVVVLVLAAAFARALPAAGDGELESPHGPLLMKAEADQAYARARGLGGKLFVESRAPLSGNGLSCASCHTERTIQRGFGRIPRHDARLGRLVTPEERIARCIERRMAGKPPQAGSLEMVGLLVHLKELQSRQPAP